MLTATRYRGNQNYTRNKTKKEMPALLVLLQEGLNNLTYKPLQALAMFTTLTILFMLSASMWLVYKNVGNALNSWSSAPKVVVYLNQNTSDNDAKVLLAKIQSRSDVSRAVYISPSQGLSQFTQQVGQNNLFSNMADSVLPGIIEVLPASKDNLYQVTQLNDELKQLSGVNASYANMNLIKQHAETLNIWKASTIISILFFGIAALLVMLMSVYLLMTSFELRTVKPKNNKMSFYASGIYLGFFSAITACLFSAVLLSNSSGYLSQWFNVQLENVTPILVVKLVLIGMMVGGIGTLIAQQWSQNFPGRR